MFCVQYFLVYYLFIVVIRLCFTANHHLIYGEHAKDLNRVEDGPLKDTK